MFAAAIGIKGGPEAFEYRELPDPVGPDDGVVIDVEAISVGSAAARWSTRSRSGRPTTHRTVRGSRPRRGRNARAAKAGTRSAAS